MAIQVPVLIVDDDENIISCIEDIISEVKVGEYEIIIETANDGVEAVGKLQFSGKRYALATVDLHMPGLDGLGVIKKVRQSESSNNDIPMIIVSGYVGDVVLDDDKLSGEFDKVHILEKPFAPEKLQKWVKIWLGDWIQKEKLDQAS